MKKNEVIEVYKPDYSKTEKVRKWTKVAKALVLAVALVVANNAEAGHHGNVWWQDKPKPRRTAERSERVVENADWEERQRVAREDFQRREAAIRERERREKIARWESIDWSRRDYDIAERVIGAWYKLRNIGAVAFNVDYTDTEYGWAKDPEMREKANVIIRVYRANHPEEFAVKAATN